MGSSIPNKEFVPKQGIMHTKYASWAIVVFSLLLLPGILLAQAPAGALRGQVTDPSGAAVTKANVILTPSTGSPITVQTDSQGLYEFKGVPPGSYTLNVVAQGFTVYENDNVVITNQALRLNVQLTIEVPEQKVQVSDTAPTVNVNPASNAGAITISGKELEALPDDPDELLTDLQALAGPSAGPNGGQLYIDGFTAGQLPPKASIREIRINQNPFSSEFDKLGYGRIEIFTKPGTDKFHGQAYVSGNDSAFNTADPFAGAEPPYDSQQYSGNLGGPLNKNASFFVNIERRNIDNLSAITAETLDPTTLLPVQTAESVSNPRARTNISPRLDYALTKNNTLTARYQYWRDAETSNLDSAFSLPSQAYNSKSTEHTVQISDTQIYGTKVVNETRFQYIRENDSQNPFDLNPAVNVPGAFTGGGNGEVSTDHQDHYELQNYTSVIHGNHTMKFGARLRALRDENFSTGGFNGTFTFSSLDLASDTPTPANCPTLTPSNPHPNPPCPISLQYAEQQLASGGIPYATQLRYTTGLPTAAVTTVDAGPYFQDDWRIRSNITLSLGLRFETQNYIHDHADWAPRLGFAWGVGGSSAPPKVVIRGGAGIFYDRFGSGNILQAERLNGITQQQFVINNPTCFPGLDQPLTDFSTCGPAIATSSTIYQVSPRFRAPGTLQAAISAERQLTKSATLSVTYLLSRGFDQQLTINSNAPFPGTPGSSVRPNPAEGNIYEYVSEGVFRQRQLIVNTNWRAGSKVQIFGYYTLNYANSDTSGGFPSNSYNISADYGRAPFDWRHRLFIGGSIALPYAFRISPFMVASAGSPFNITVPTDLNGDSIFNDRPGLAPGASCTAPNIYCTPFGTLDARPDLAATPEKLLPINYATGPAHFTLNLRLTRTFAFGPKVKSSTGSQGPGGGGPGGGGRRGGPLFGTGPMISGPGSDRRYNLSFGVNARNVFNRVNLSNPSGVLGSSFFDASNSLYGGPFSQGVANRRIDLLATFSF
jgi:hypothetical protein